ncbi:MAG TPA: hypothetical protein PLI55_09275 [Candidatus Marinimicrobia bacterium]|nr:hypothetical protein [Candidatus Neomarinimicrobiota bacterium]
MNRKNIEDWIPIAIEITQQWRSEKLKHPDKLSNDEEKQWELGIPSKYFGYLDSFGPTILQSGIINSLTFYCQESGGADRIEIANLIRDVLISSNTLTRIPNPNLSLLELTQDKISQDRFYWRNRIFEAIIACKMALKLFHRAKPEDVQSKDGEAV